MFVYIFLYKCNFIYLKYFSYDYRGNVCRETTVQFVEKLH